MTTLIWLYQFIGAVFLGFILRTAREINPKPYDWAICILLAIVWPYAIWLIYRAEVKK